VAFAAVHVPVPPSKVAFTPCSRFASALASAGVAAGTTINVAAASDMIPVNRDSFRMS
jgi:hypothetical protein